jgi:hypothetical protein
LPRRLAGILLLAVLCLTGCGWQGTGTVVEKTFSPAYDYITFQCMGFDGKGNCTLNMPINNHVSESYGYKVRDDADGKIHDVTVNQTYWNTYGVGTHFDNREKK